VTASVTSADVNGEQGGGLGALLPTPEAGSPSPRLVQAAHQFEGMMMKELLKPMSAGDPLTGADEADADDSSGSNGALGEFATEALGQAMSERGGFGIANKIIGELGGQSGARGEGPRVTTGRSNVTTNLHGNTARILNNSLR
jgi:flagellar protein FlgJ